MTLSPIRKRQDNKLTAMMQVRNEADRFLPDLLREVSEFVDEIVIVDDASTDHTVSLCRSFPKVVRLLEMPTPLFHTEWKLRRILWDATASTEPDWVLALDADEFYEDRAKQEMRSLLNQDEFDWVGYRFFDFWGGTTHYREDEHWNAHQRHTMTLVRYLKPYHYVYPMMDHHVPRLPVTYQALPGYCSEGRVKHYGWVESTDDLQKKYDRYLQADPRGQWGSLAHYQSILDSNPRLIEWKE